MRLLWAAFGLTLVVGACVAWPPLRRRWQEHADFERLLQAELKAVAAKPVPPPPWLGSGHPTTRGRRPDLYPVPEPPSRPRHHP